MPAMRNDARYGREFDQCLRSDSTASAAISAAAADDGANAEEMLLKALTVEGMQHVCRFGLEPFIFIQYISASLRLRKIPPRASGSWRLLGFNVGGPGAVSSRSTWHHCLSADIYAKTG